MTVGPTEFQTPEEAAMFGFPQNFCRVVAVQVDGDDAYFVLNTGSADQPYLYGVSCQRVDGRWRESSSSNCEGGWSQSSQDPSVGTLTLWGEAPDGADMVRGDFEGRILEAPVSDIAFLLVWRRVPEPETWPSVTAFRINGSWV